MSQTADPAAVPEPSANGLAHEVVAVVLAAGQGTRVGSAINKVFLPLQGKPIVVRAVEPFQASRSVDRVVLVVAEADEAYCRREILGRFWLPKVRHLIRGGSSRAESEYNALQFLRPEIESGRVGIVLVHDAARPLLSAALLESLVATARIKKACIPALPPRDAMVRAPADGRIAEAIRTESIRLVQTPQAFEAGLLLDSYTRAWQAGFASTDTASAVEWAGHQVHVIPGDPRNLKITTSDDLLYAETLMRRHRDRK